MMSGWIYIPFSELPKGETMNINNVEFAVDCYDVIQELQTQLHLNNVPLINKIVDTPNNVQICCPYHKNGQERRPSAGIKKSDGTFHCLACGEVHTLPEVISYCFGHTEDMFGKFGWEWLLKNFATIQVENRHEIDLDFGRCNSSSNVSNMSDIVGCASSDDNNKQLVSQFVSEEELDRYRYYHPYWGKRGITDEWIIELFDLGYDKDTECITMPVRNKNGITLFVARRSVRTKYFNYPAGVEKPLYGLYELQVSSQSDRYEQVFICESMIDALLLWQSGHYAFALNGLGSSSQIEELKRLHIRKYILCTDNDNAGEKARVVLRKALRNKLLSEIRFPPNRKDVGECTKEEIDNILNWEVL